jgi:putative transposase
VGWPGCSWSSPTPTSGLRQAVNAVMAGAAIQRCRVHFLRNVLARVPKGSAEMVAAAIRTIFAQPDATHVHEQLDVIAGMLGRQFPKLETMLRDNAEELLAFTSFPISHWKKLGPPTRWSGSTRRANAAPTSSRCSQPRRAPSPRRGRCWSRPTTKWQVSDRRYLSEGSMALLTTTTKEVTPAQLMPA